MRSKAKISFIEFIRPGSCWPYPYTLEQAFGVLQWMARTGRKYSRKIEWGYHGPIEALSCQPTCRSFCSVSAITTIADLRERFHYALLTNYDESGAIAAWRNAERITLDGKRILTFPHHEPFSGGQGWNCEADIQKAIEKLFNDGQNSRLAVQLNSSWDAARECHKVVIHVLPAFFVFDLKYGFDGSTWTHELARTKDNEPFLCTMRRAVDAFYSLIEEVAA